MTRGIIYNTMMQWDVVLDTNVFFSGLKSTKGASHRLLRELGRNRRVQIHLSVPLVLEYEELAKQQSRALGLTFQDIDDILDYLCSIAELHQIFYLWRPILPDFDDDMLLELAVEAECQYIITFNINDFRGTEQFDIQAITPRELLRLIGATS